MRAQGVAASLNGRREGSATLRRASLILVSCWTLTGAALGVWVFRSWWAHPVPVFNPATDGPIPPPGDSMLDVTIQAVSMAVLLAGLWTAAAASGSSYLRSAQPTRRWLVAWEWPVAAAAAAGVLFIAVYWDPVPLFGQMMLGHPSWGLLAFPAAFLLAGTTMVAIITATARQARRQAGEA